MSLDPQAWYPGISAVSPRHVPLRPEQLSALPHWRSSGGGPPVLYLVLLGAKDPLKLVQDRLLDLVIFREDGEVYLRKDRNSLGCISEMCFMVFTRSSCVMCLNGFDFVWNRLCLFLSDR